MAQPICCIGDSMAVVLCSTGASQVWLWHAAMSHNRFVADGEDLSVASKPRQWVAAVYYVTATITTARARPIMIMFRAVPLFSLRQWVAAVYYVTAIITTARARLIMLRSARSSALQLLRARARRILLRHD